MGATHKRASVARGSRKRPVAQRRKAAGGQKNTPANVARKSPGAAKRKAPEARRLLKKRSWRQESRLGIPYCNESGCMLRPVFGFPDHPRSRCTAHKMRNMERGPLCARCHNIAVLSVPTPESVEQVYCSLHARRTSYR